MDGFAPLAMTGCPFAAPWMAALAVTPGSERAVMGRFQS